MEGATAGQDGDLLAPLPHVPHLGSGMATAAGQRATKSLMAKQGPASELHWLYLC